MYVFCTVDNFYTCYTNSFAYSDVSYKLKKKSSLPLNSAKVPLMFTACCCVYTYIS